MKTPSVAISLGLTRPEHALTATAAPATTIRLSAGVITRFRSKVGHPTSTGCWPWTGARSADGYGYLSVAGRAVCAHRIAFLIWREEIPAGLTIDHLCRQRSCVRPSHLEPVTSAENVKRGSVSRRAERVRAMATAVLTAVA